MLTYFKVGEKLSSKNLFAIYVRKIEDKMPVFDAESCIFLRHFLMYFFFLYSPKNWLFIILLHLLIVFLHSHIFSFAYFVLYVEELSVISLMNQVVPFFLSLNPNTCLITFTFEVQMIFNFL